METFKNKQKLLLEDLSGQVIAEINKNQDRSPFISQSYYFITLFYLPQKQVLFRLMPVHRD